MHELAHIRSNKLLAINLLKNIGIESARLDVELLLAKAISKDRLSILLDQENLMNPHQMADFFSLLKRRLCYEPMAYILEEKEFFGLLFKVNQYCLIPRPDTECIVEKCLSLISFNSYDTVFDLCTGSGAIAISLLCNLPNIKMIASDISKKALMIAKKNAFSLGVAKRLLLRQGDLFDVFYDNEKASLIVANPPYIPSLDINNLSADIRNFEPKEALDGGKGEGLDFYHKILARAIYFLHDQGYLVLEIGFNQEKSIAKLIHPPLRLVDIIVDLGNQVRGLVIKKT